VSTQYGVGFEYFPSKKTTIKIIKGSARLEELIINGPNPLKKADPLIIVGGRLELFSPKVLLYDLRFPFRMVSDRSTVLIGNVLFESSPLKWHRKIIYAELFGDRREEHWTKERATSCAKDEVLAALSELNRAQIKDVHLEYFIEKYKKKTVLVLGSYDDPGIRRIDNIVSSLIELGYEPLLIKNIPDSPYQDLPQKVANFALLSRFVVIDDSMPSGHLIEIEICKNLRVVTILLRSGGVASSWMTAGTSYTSNVILEKQFNQTDPLPSLKEAVDWAETTLHRLKIKFENTYPWRKLN
jgi:hypothetical protein